MIIRDPYYNLPCHYDFKLLPSYFICITLFGHLFFNISENELIEYFKQSRGKCTLHHEYLHTLQAKSFKTKYLGFYACYLYYWIKNLFKFGVRDYLAYENIPFEKECYAKEYDYDYNETNWKNYIS